MNYVRIIVLNVIVLLAICDARAQTQDATPKGAFKAVHLVNVKTPADVATLQSAIAEMNGAVAKAGAKDVRYRLYKVAGTQTGSQAYMFESSWPSGEVYDKVHKSAEWIAATKEHPLDAVTTDQIYNRYIEVTKQ
jgi:hypothetical protein